MKKIDLYIIKRFLGTFFFAMALLIVVVIVIDFSENVDEFIDKEASMKAILFSYYVNFIPYFYNLFGPLFTFIAVVFFTSQMAARSETIAILSSGISYYRMLLPYLYGSIILALLLFYLSNFLIPVTNRTLIDFQNTYLKSPNSNRDVDIHFQVEAGKFIYLESFNNESMSGHRFSMEEFGSQGLTKKLKADLIRWDSTKQSWILDNYYIRTIDGHKETLTRGNRLDTAMNFIPADLNVSFDDVKVMSFWQLRDFIKQEELKGNENVAEYSLEKHRRITGPFSTLILTFIGAALSSRKSRGGIGWHLGAGIAISFIFILFMQVSNTFAIYGSLQPGLASWLPNILFGILAAVLISLAPK